MTSLNFFNYHLHLLPANEASNTNMSLQYRLSRRQRPRLGYINSRHYDSEFFFFLLAYRKGGGHHRLVCGSLQSCVTPNVAATAALTAK
ncbi:hypothetical protein CEXT_476091 [Caerostris extrusa]|uniref:Uncharacterized protein n=1 Tax=Caerostris extrusa TaxID=172846 RepID=A0AAV4N8K2_CAEEX|nr:hypothetical protein CEXT_476091 [Caerostris extrusa]